MSTRKKLLILILAFLGLLIVGSAMSSYLSWTIPGYVPGILTISPPKSHFEKVKPDPIEDFSAHMTQQASTVSELTTSPEFKKLSWNNIKGDLNTASQKTISENQAKLLELTSPLYDKYSFLDEATGLSIPFFESTYQKQQSSITNLQHLQSIEYRSDVANVLAVVQEESDRLLKVIAQVKNLQDYAKRGMGMLVAVNKEYGSTPIEEDFRKFVNGETIKVNEYIYMFNPKNPDSLGNVVYERDMRNTELQEVLTRSIQNTR